MRVGVVDHADVRERSANRRAHARLEHRRAERGGDAARLNGAAADARGLGADLGGHRAEEGGVGGSAVRGVGVEFLVEVTSHDGRAADVRRARPPALRDVRVAQERGGRGRHREGRQQRTRRLQEVGGAGGALLLLSGGRFWRFFRPGPDGAPLRIARTARGRLRATLRRGRGGGGDGCFDPARARSRRRHRPATASRV